MTHKSDVPQPPKPKAKPKPKENNGDVFSIFKAAKTIWKKKDGAHNF